MGRISILPFIIFLLLANSASYSQSALLGIAELKVSLAVSEKAGNNGTAVAYNPLENIYFAVFAGSEEFPMEKFDSLGGCLSSAKAGIDVRGMWWDPKTKSLEVNAFGDQGYFKMVLDENGNPAGEAINFIQGRKQPSEQNVAAFDPLKQRLFFYLDGTVYSYSLKNGKQGKKDLVLEIPVDLSQINSNSMIYTGIKGIEIGILNYIDSKLLLFDLKSGKLSGSVKFIHNAPMNEAFGFSYANNMVWLYNKEYRIWYGYKIFI